MARRPSSRQGARARSSNPLHQVSAWLRQHAHAGRFAIDKFLAAPIPSLMTSLVIGIALALPASFTMLLENVSSLSASWDASGNVTVYLDESVSDSDGAALARELNARPDVLSTRFIGRDEALATFRKYSGFGDVLEAIDENPLPAAIVLQPAPGSDTAAGLGALAAVMAERPEVETAEVDLEWIQRLNAIVELVKRSVLVVGALLALAVLLVVGNTIRLDIYSRRDEIVVTKLIGATNAFVRRPFLYGGLIYGLSGGVLAVMLVILALRFLDGPSEYLATLYGGGFELASVDPVSLAVTLLAGAVLGLVGSWLAVGRHLHEIEPR